ncbi:ketoacyl-synthetase C-terminal extension domain-containing protein [Variovorax sp. NFACC27]|uniref:KS-MAT linker domain-containing protein n=1 Tax=Variovorax sp. NFACC27 TaxID=1566274 RepID=UPI003AB06375
MKTNIGHLELAAGVAGIVKVLLQFKHRTLVPSLHAKEINPYIDLSGSPFYVVQESREWVALRDDAGRELPRRAGVSSFGVGGVNAHVVLQEYRSAEPARAKVVVTPQRPVVVVLSAKQEVRLREAVQRLLAHVERQGCTDEDLADIAYTLQVGREAMEVRLACVVSTLEELKAKLAQYLAEAKDIDGLYIGARSSETKRPSHSWRTRTWIAPSTRGCPRASCASSSSCGYGDSRSTGRGCTTAK